MRRGPGIAGLQSAARAREQYKATGTEVKKATQEQMKLQLELFKSKLEEFARRYKNDIKKDPAFRAQFHTMCANIGVDPLASSKGIWTELLGFGDFYYELGVQVIEACLATRSTNGGLMELRSLLGYVQKRRGSLADPISDDDIIRAIKKLKVLGNGFDLVTLGKQQYVRSMPAEMNTDTTRLLEVAQGPGYVSRAEVMRTLGWDGLRVDSCLQLLLKQGMVMIDDGAPDGVRLYWFPCLGVMF